MEDAYVINGGKKLTGDITLSGAKNVALKAIVAALLFDNEVVLRNVPRINDVFELIKLVHSIGGKAEFTGNNELSIDGQGINTNQFDLLHAEKIRVSFMLIAPLLYKFGKARIPNPGGCRIGARPIDRSIEGLRALGVAIEYDSGTGYYNAAMDEKPHGRYHFLKPSHTGTELLIVMGVFTRKGVVIENAALEPEVDDIINLLNEGGAKISREGTTIRIQGAQKLMQKKPFMISSDRNEAITYAIMGVVTGGDVTIHPITESNIRAFIDACKKANVGVDKISEDTWRFYNRGGLRGVDIVTSPHPGFMTDWQQPWSVLMSQSSGPAIIQERVFEDRFAYVSELRKLGLEIDFVKVPVRDPKEYFFFNYNPDKIYNSAIRIRGPQKIHEGVLHVTDLRAGATLVIAALIAEGESFIEGASELERGYENFIGKVKKLGGDIRKV